MSNDRFAPLRRWPLAVRCEKLPRSELGVYDLVQGSIVRHLMPTGLEDDWFASGAWSGDHFFFYASKHDGSSARLWMACLARPISEKELLLTRSHRLLAARHIHLPFRKSLAAETNLFVYEAFGFIGDRRVELFGPNSRRSLANRFFKRPHASTCRARFIFSALIPDREEPVLYGLSCGGPNWEFPVKLVRMDARDGQILQTRTLDTDRWKSQ